MNRAFSWFFGVLIVFSGLGSVHADESGDWTWVCGRLDVELLQKNYQASVEKTFAWYQEKSNLPGRLVCEDDLDGPPQGPAVFIGPVAAFEHPEWFGVPMKVLRSGEVTIGKHDLKSPRTGIYLRSREGNRIVYTGLSLEGFKDIFGVHTGRRACTITVDKLIRYEGDYGHGGLEIEALSFLGLYPTPEELAGIDIPEGALVLAPVTKGRELDGLEPAFSAWLGGFAYGRKVLFVGESHWNVGVNRMFHLMVEDLLAKGMLSSVFLELNYSFGAFYNHYVFEPDDERAARFLEERLHPLVRSQNVLDLLDLLRRWNVLHPDNQVGVGCVDMEWSVPNVIKHILNPYLLRIDSKFSFADPYTLRKLGLQKRQQKRLQALLARADREEIVGEYDFITPAYIENVITNVYDTVKIDDFNVDRQKGIIRNIVEFNGDLLEGEGLAVFKGGGFHAIKRKLDGEAFYHDAAYLNEVHPPTRGNVATIYLRGVGYSFADIAGLNLKDHMSSATKYNEFVKNFQEALASGNATKDAIYLLGRRELSTFEKLLARSGYLMNQDVVRLESVHWDALKARFGNAVEENGLDDYDALIYVLRSKIEVTRPREFQKE